MRTRMKPIDRKETILSAAIELSIEQSYVTLTRNQVAKRSKVSPALVNQYFGTMNGLKIAIMTRAVNYKIYKIIAQGLVHQNPITNLVDVKTKEKARCSI